MPQHAGTTDAGVVRPHDRCVTRNGPDRVPRRVPRICHSGYLAETVGGWADRAPMARGFSGRSGTRPRSTGSESAGTPRRSSRSPHVPKASPVIDAPVLPLSRHHLRLPVNVHIPAHVLVTAR
jgi:hypothetical protein